MKPAGIPGAPPDDEDDSNDPSPPGDLREKLAVPGSRSKSKLKLALVVGLLAAAGGGYAAWIKFAPNREAAVDLASDSPGEPDTDDESDATDNSSDPFESSSAGKPARPRDKEPRVVNHANDASPIGESDFDARQKKKMARTDDDSELDMASTLELPDDQSEPDGEQTEPDADDDAVPELRLPAPGRPGLSPVAIDSDDADEDELPHRAPPRLGRNDAAKSDDQSESSDDKLDGFTFAPDRSASTSSRSMTDKARETSSGGSKISIVDVPDEEPADDPLEGYVVDEKSNYRAASKTVVTRATSTEAESKPRITPAAPRGSEAASSVRRSPPVGFAEPHDDRAASGATPSPRASGQGEMYTVAPGDNFWTISRKQYGSARYFNALVRHNQNRVADPQRLRPGTVISTPPATVLEQKYPELIEKTPAGSTPGDRSSSNGAEKPSKSRPSDAGAGASKAQSPGYFYDKNTGAPMYRIGPDDTLTGIAQRHLGKASRSIEIYEQNRNVLKSPDDLTVGTTIRLPLDASRVGWVPDEERRR